MDGLLWHSDIGLVLAKLWVKLTLDYCLSAHVCGVDFGVLKCP